MRKTIFVLLSLLLTLTGCSKETLPETSSVPSEDTHITSPTDEKRNKIPHLLLNLPKLPKRRKKPLHPRRKTALPTVP